MAETAQLDEAPPIDERDDAGLDEIDKILSAEEALLDDVEEVDEVSTEAPPAVGTPPVAHPPELLDRASALLIPAEEAAAMSADELRRAIKIADRVGQTVYDSLSKKPVETPLATTTLDKPIDELAVLDDPERYDQEYVKPIKAVLAKHVEENRDLRARLEKLEKNTQAASQHTLHSRLMTHATDAEVAKALDLSTPTGQARYKELLDEMGVKQRHNPNLTEKQLFERAVKAMELVPEKPKEAPEAAAKKRKWDDGALAQPAARKSADTALDVVGRILREAKAAERKPRTNGHSGQ